MSGLTDRNAPPLQKRATPKGFHREELLRLSNPGRCARAIALLERLHVVIQQTSPALRNQILMASFALLRSKQGGTPGSCHVGSTLQVTHLMTSDDI